MPKALSLPSTQCDRALEIVSAISHRMTSFLDRYAQCRPRRTVPRVPVELGG